MGIIRYRKKIIIDNMSDIKEKEGDKKMMLTFIKIIRKKTPHKLSLIYLMLLTLVICFSVGCTSMPFVSKPEVNVDIIGSSPSIDILKTSIVEKVTLEVVNEGNAPAKETKVSVIAQTNDNITLGSGTVELGTIGVGGKIQKDVEIPLNLGGVAKLFLGIKDGSIGLKFNTSVSYV